MATTTPVDRLVPGDHACLTCTDAEERRDLLAAFETAGLERGERVIRYCGEAPLWQDAPDARVMVERVRDEIERSANGLRITADMCWATRPQADAEQLLAFETGVAELFADRRLTAICAYDRGGFDPVTLAYAARVHSRTVAATIYHEDPVLRICRQHVPPGVRVAGELDYRRAGALTAALAEAVRLDRDVHLNLTSLRFLDAGAAGVILRTAANLPKARRMFVACGDVVGRTLTVAGADRVPALRLMVRHARR